MLLRSVYDTNELPILRTLALELHKSVLLGEQGVIAAEANILASVDTCATLANDDISGNNFLAAVDFDAQAFTLRIATVLGTAACFFMCHCTVPVCFIT